MNLKRKLILIKRLSKADRPQNSRQFVFLRFVAFGGICLSLVFGLLFCIAYVHFSQTLPPIANFETKVQEKLTPSVFLDQTGENILLELEYPAINPRKLRVCENESDCFSGAMVRVINAVDQMDREDLSHANLAWLLNPTPKTIAEKLAADVYAEDCGAGWVKGLTLRILGEELEAQFGKTKLSEWYLNRAYFGQLAFGADAAALTYLNKSASELTLAEAVLLSAILKAPALNPIDSQGAVQDTYLEQTEQLFLKNKISDDERDSLVNTTFTIYEAPNLDYHIAPNPILQKALNGIIERFGRESVEKGGFRIVTTLNYELQTTLDCLGGNVGAANGMEDCPLLANKRFTENKLKNYTEILKNAPLSLALIDNQNGHLIAALDTSGFHGTKPLKDAAFSPHSPGSLLSVFTGLYAYSMGYSPSSLVWDLANERSDSVPIRYKNPDEKYHGPVRLRKAITNDLLIPLDALANRLGSAADPWKQAATFGLSGLTKNSGTGLLFGEGTATTEDIAHAFSVFANLGTQAGYLSHNTLRPISVISVEKANQRFPAIQPESERSIIDPALSYLINHTLSEEDQAFVNIDRPAAKKSGLIFNQDELWFAGYVPQYSCAVWMGASPNAPDNQDSAISLWRTIMQIALADEPGKGWDRPENIRQVMVCNPSGLLPGDHCPETVSEVFLYGNEPQTTDTLYVQKAINRDNQLLATRFTSPDALRKQIFLNLPENALEWAESEKIELSPREYDPISPNGLIQDQKAKIFIYAPEPFQPFEISAGTRSIDVKAEIKAEDPLQFFQISTGEGFYPELWTERCSGESIQNGRWHFCALQLNDFKPGLYCLRLSIVTSAQRFYEANTYFIIQDDD